MGSENSDFHKLVKDLGKSRNLNIFSQWPLNYDGILSRMLMDHKVCTAMNIAVNRRLIRTRKVYLGLFSERFQYGDSIILLKGARVPFVIRKSGISEAKQDQTWEIIGDGYLQGMMSGKAWDETRCESLLLSGVVQQLGMFNR
jgi:hypothetical protein